MKNRNFKLRQRLTAFTLIEMLVVITVISVLLAISAPALFNTMKSTRLGGAGDRLLGALSDAQQTAFSHNYPVEVRFYYYNIPLGTKDAYRSYQLFSVTNPPGENTEKVTKMSEVTKLPDNIIVSANSQLSPSLAKYTFEDSSVSAGVSNAHYSAIRFMPDGTCRTVTTSGEGLPVLVFPTLTDNFVTLHEEGGSIPTDGTLPPNFYIIQTDPYTGKSRYYRPGF